MAKFTGSGLLSKYGCRRRLSSPLLVKEIAGLLEIPKELAEELIVVKESRILSEDEYINDGDDIRLFISLSGG